jgi:formylmethanofuran dehydrogenase subunit E
MLITPEMLEGAVKFHGHLGPYLVLGLKAGLLGVERIGRKVADLYAIVETKPAPPHSCFIDGIQFSSGCTFGKRNIEFRAGGGASVVFIGGSRRLRVTVLETVLKSLDGISSREETEALGRKILAKDEFELFKVEEDFW